ncbi:cbb3-type cytochrome c oxidase subunit II, partial [Klebsiella pneumoniae]|uniref:cbb3-type cytochrome c oxidase subunit II n=2 Tax=Pseudomonadota TaxID=1224 RepID=UPI00200D3BEC
MHSETRLVLGGLTTLAVATAALVVLPYLTVRDTPPAPGLKPYTASALRGRTQYIQHGCMYCHSQQPRARDFAPDAKRGWGRATVAGDYA